MASSINNNVNLGGTQSIKVVKTFASIKGPTAGLDSNSTVLATTEWVNNKLFLDTSKRTTLSVSLDKSVTIPNNGFLTLSIAVGSQTDAKVNVLLSNSDTATSQSYIVCAVAHNGGSAESNIIPVVIPVKRNQSIYLDWSGTGSASVKSAFLFGNS